MANPDRDTVYTNDGTGTTNRTIYSRESNSTGWFVGIIVALALLAIAYLVFSANSQPSTTTINNTPAVTTPATPATPADNTAVTPMAPANTAPADTTTAPSTPVASSIAPMSSVAPMSSAAPVSSDAAPASSALASSAAQ